MSPQVLPFDQWAETEGASLTGLEQIQAYGDHYRLNSFAAGKYNPQEAKEVDKRLFTLARNRGLVDGEDETLAAQQFVGTAEPEEINDDDLEQIVSQKFYNKEAGESEVRSYLAARKIDGMQPELLEQRREAAAEWLTPQSVRDARASAVLRGDAPFAVLKDEDGNAELVVDPSRPEPTNEQIAEWVKANPRLASSRDLPLIKSAYEIPEGLTAPRHKVARNSELRAMLGDDKVNEETRATVDRVIEEVAEGNMDRAREYAKDLRNQKYFSDRYSEDDLVNAAMDLAQSSVNTESPRILSTGEVIMPTNLLINKDEHDAAVDAMNISPSQKALTKKARATQLEARSGLYHKLATSFGDEDYVNFYEGQKAEGKKDGEIIEAWFSDEKNYSGFKQRAEGLALSTIIDGLGGIALYPMALFGNEDARDTVASFTAYESRRQQYAAMFGDEFGIGYTILKTAPAVAADIALSVATAGTGGLLSAGTKFTFKQAAKIGIRSALKEATVELAEQAVKKGVKGSVSAALRATGDDFTASLIKFGKQAATLTPATFNRAAGSSYVSVYSALEAQNPDWTPDQIRAAAFGHAVIQGATTTGITVGFQGLALAFPKWFGAGVEEWATGGSSGLTMRQLNKAYQQIARAPGKIPAEIRGYLNLETFNTFVGSIAKEGTRNSLLAFGRQALSEGMEEGLDQFVGAFLEANATNQDVDVPDALRQALHAAIVGGAFGLGGGVKEVGLRSNVSEQQYRRFEQDTYGQLASALDNFGDVESAAFLRSQAQAARNNRSTIQTQLEQFGTHAALQEQEVTSRAQTSKRIETASQIQGKAEKLQEFIAGLEQIPAAQRSSKQVQDLVAARKLSERYAASIAELTDPETQRALSTPPEPGALLGAPGVTVAEPGQRPAPDVSVSTNAESKAKIAELDKEIARLEGYGENQTAYQKDRLRTMKWQRNALSNISFTEATPPTELERFQNLTSEIRTAEARVRNLEARFPDAGARPAEVKAAIKSAKASVTSLKTKRGKIVDPAIAGLAEPKFSEEWGLPASEQNEFGETQYTFGLDPVPADVREMLSTLSAEETERKVAELSAKKRERDARTIAKVNKGGKATKSEAKSLATKSIDESLAEDASTIFGWAKERTVSAEEDAETSGSVAKEGTATLYGGNLNAELRAIEGALHVALAEESNTLTNTVPDAVLEREMQALDELMQEQLGPEPERTVTYTVAESGHQIFVLPAFAEVGDRVSLPTGQATRTDILPGFFPEDKQLIGRQRAGFKVVVQDANGETVSTKTFSDFDAADAAAAEAAQVEAGKDGEVLRDEQEAPADAERRAAVAEDPSKAGTKKEIKKATTRPKQTKEQKGDVPQGDVPAEPAAPEGSAVSEEDDAGTDTPPAPPSKSAQKLAKAVTAELTKAKVEADARKVATSQVLKEKVEETRAKYDMETQVAVLYDKQPEVGEHYVYDSWLYRVKLDPKTQELKRVKVGTKTVKVQKGNAPAQSKERAVKELKVVSKKTGKPIAKQPPIHVVQVSDLTLEGPDGRPRFLRPEDETLFNSLLESGNVPEPRHFYDGTFELASHHKLYLVPFLNTLRRRVDAKWEPADLSGVDLVKKTNPDAVQQAAIKFVYFVSHKPNEERQRYTAEQLIRAKRELRAMLDDGTAKDREFKALAKAIDEEVQAELELQPEDDALLDDVEIYEELDRERLRLAKLEKSAEKRVDRMRKALRNGVITKDEFADAAAITQAPVTTLRTRIEQAENSPALARRPQTMADLTPGLARLVRARRARARIEQQIKSGDYQTDSILDRLKEIENLLRRVQDPETFRIEVDPRTALSTKQQNIIRATYKQHTLDFRRNKSRKVSRGNRTLNLQIPFIETTRKQGVIDAETGEELTTTELEPVFTNDPATTAAAISAGFAVRVPQKYRGADNAARHPGIDVDENGWVTSAFDPLSQTRVSQPGDLSNTIAPRAYTPSELKNSLRQQYANELPSVPSDLFGVVGATARGTAGEDLKAGAGKVPRRYLNNPDAFPGDRTSAGRGLVDTTVATDAPYIEDAIAYLDGRTGGTQRRRAELKAEKIEKAEAVKYRKVEQEILGTETEPGPLEVLRQLAANERFVSLPTVKEGAVPPSLRAELAPIGRGDLAEVQITRPQLDEARKVAAKDVVAAERAVDEARAVADRLAKNEAARVRRLAKVADTAGAKPAPDGSGVTIAERLIDLRTQASTLRGQISIASEAEARDLGARLVAVSGELRAFSENEQVAAYIKAREDAREGSQLTGEQAQYVKTEVEAAKQAARDAVQARQVLLGNKTELEEELASLRGLTPANEDAIKEVAAQLEANAVEIAAAEKAVAEATENVNTVEAATPPGRAEAQAELSAAEAQLAAARRRQRQLDNTAALIEKAQAALVDEGGEQVVPTDLEDQIAALEQRLAEAEAEFESNVASARAIEREDVQDLANAGQFKSKPVRELEELARRANGSPDEARDMVLITYVESLREFALAYRLAELESKTDKNLVKWMKENLSPTVIDYARTLNRRDALKTRVPATEFLDFLTHVDGLPARADIKRKFNRWAKGQADPNNISQQQFVEFLNENAFEDEVVAAAKAWLDTRFSQALTDDQVLANYAKWLLRRITDPDAKANWVNGDGTVSPPSLLAVIASVKRRYQDALRNGDPVTMDSIDSPDESYAGREEEIARAMSELYGTEEDDNVFGGLDSEEVSSVFFQRTAALVESSTPIRLMVEELAEELGMNPENYGPTELWAKVHDALLHSPEFVENLHSTLRNKLKEIYRYGIRERAAQLAVDVEETVEGHRQAYSRIFEKAGLERDANLIRTGAKNPELRTDAAVFGSAKLKPGYAKLAPLQPSDTFAVLRAVSTDPALSQSQRQIAAGIIAEYGPHYMPSIEFLTSSKASMIPWIGAYSPDAEVVTINLTKPDQTRADTILRAVVQHLVSVETNEAPEAATTKALQKLHDKLMSVDSSLGTLNPDESVRFAMLDPGIRARVAARKPKFMGQLVQYLTAKLGLKGGVAFNRVRNLLNAGDQVWGTSNLRPPRAAVRNRPVFVPESVMDIVNGAMPAGVRAVASDNHTHPAWVSSASPNVVFVNPDTIHSMVSGLSESGRKQVINALVNHELAHVASLATLTPQDRAQILANMTPKELAKVRARVPAGTEGVSLAEEYVRMKVEEATSGIDSDALVYSILRHGTGIKGRLIRHFQKFANALARLVGERPSYRTLVHIDNVRAALASIQRDGLPLRPVPTTDITGHMTAIETGLAEGTDRTFFAVPIHSTDPSVESWWGRVKRHAQLKRDLRRVETDMAYMKQASGAIVDNFLIQVKAAEKRGVRLSPGAINAALGSADAYLTEADERMLKAALEADRKAGYDEAALQSRAKAREENAKRATVRQREAEQAAALAQIDAADPTLGAAVRNFREDITRLSKEVGAIAKDAELKAVYDRNQNVHLVRSYDFFNSRAWATAALKGAAKGTVPEFANVDFNKLKGDAILAIKDWHLRTYGRAIDGKTAWSKLQGWLKALSTQDPHSLSGSVLAKNDSLFKSKADFPAEVRALLGERSTVESAAHTHIKLATWLAKTEAAKNFRTTLLNSGVVFDSPHAPDGTPLEPLFPSFQSDDNYEDLHGLYAYPGEADLIHSTLRSILPSEGAVGDAVSNAIASGTVRFLGASMTLKTLFSVGFFTRNEGTNSLYLRPMQGDWRALFDFGGLFGRGGRHARIAAGGVGLRRFGGGRFDFARNEEQYTTELLQLGLLKDDVHATIIRDLWAAGSERNDLLNDVRDFAEGKEPAAWISKFFQGKAGAKRALRFATKDIPGALAELNEVIDGKAKIGLYEYELATLLKIRDETGSTESDMDVKRKAAAKVHRVMQGHSQVWTPVQRFARSPVGVLIAPFARFKAEMTRVIINTPLLALEEIKEGRAIGSPTLVKHGVKRLASFAFVNTAWSSILVSAFSAIFGMLDGDDDDDNKSLLEESMSFEVLSGETGKTLRMGLPKWQRNHTVFARRNGDGTVTTIDLTYYNPLSILHDPARVFIDRLTTDGFDSAVAGFTDVMVSDFVGEGIATGAIRQIATNQNDYGDSIFLETDDLPTRTAKILTHYFDNALKPSGLSKAEQVYEAIKLGDKAVNGDRAYDAGNIILGEILGVRPRDLNERALLQRSARNTKLALDDVGSLLGPFNSPRYQDADDLKQAYHDYAEAYTEVWNQHRRNAAAWRKFMGKGGDVEYLKAMVESGQSKDRSRKAILQGVVDRPVRSKASLETMYRAGEQDGAEGGEARVMAYRDAVLEYPRLLRLDDFE